MTSKEAKTHIIDTLNGDMNKEYFINELLPEILKALERLDEIENLRTTPNALETCLANYMNKCIDLEKENQELKDTNMKYAKLIDDFQSKNMRLEKTLEIIKKKCDFMPLSKIKNLSYDLYVRWFDLNHYEVKLLLTKEEFDLLKEVLEEL